MKFFKILTKKKWLKFITGVDLRQIPSQFQPEMLPQPLSDIDGL